MDKNFLIAYDDTVVNEGSLSNNQNDLGGLTWKGIARNMHPSWEGWFLIDQHLKAKHNKAIILKDTTLESMVQKFYYNSFWLKLQCDKILNVEISKKLFDTAVNMGESAAIKFAEAAVKVKQDGKIDSELIEKLNQIV